MVRLITILLLANLCIVIARAQEENRFDPLMPREHKVITNFSHAIDAFYKRTGQLPKSLMDIQEETDLRWDYDTSGLATLTQRYALLQKPLEVPQYGKAVMVSINLLMPEGQEHNYPKGGRMIAFINDKFGNSSSGFVPANIIEPILKSSGEILMPIGGTIPPPSWAKPPSTEPVIGETMKRALEMKARGELPTPKRRDKETWRDEKPVTPPPASTLPPAPVTPPPAKSSYLQWWFIGTISALAAMILVARKKKSKR